MSLTVSMRDPTFGELLKQYRRSAGWTQEELAEYAGLSPRGVSDLERGERRWPRGQTVQLLAEALGLNASQAAALHAAGQRRSTRTCTSGQHPRSVPSNLRLLSRPANHNLPFQPTTFIGREREVGEVAERLCQARLITVTGAGGCGKTRLAVEIARRLLEVYPDGVWLVELAPEVDPSLVPRAIATVLDLREVPGEPITTTLTAYMRPKQLLLLVDNCEHLIEGVAGLVSGLIRTCPSLQVLATSREPLAVPGEVVWRVPSLATPDCSCSLDQIGDYEAVRLFVDRAAAVERDFTLSNRNAPAVARICERLDGIPLAIELAAACISVLQPEQIATRLDDRFHLLAGGRSVAARHRTLRAAIDWSFDLLDDSERTLFRRLAVFAGGFTLDAAEAVCPDQGPNWEGEPSRSDRGDTVPAGVSCGDVLRLLTALVAKSLVVVEGTGREKRYRLLETVRQYARERLSAAGEVANLGRRHRDWLLSFAMHGEIELRGPAQAEWLERLDAEGDNLRAVLKWCEAEPDQTEAGLRLASALWWYWFLRDRLTEGQSHLERLLARSEGSSVPVRTTALWRAAFLALWAEALARSEELGQEALSQCHQAADQHGVAWTLNVLGWIARRRGNPAVARAYFEQSLAMFRATGDLWAVAGAVVDLGSFLGSEGDDQAARECYSEALMLWRALGDARGIATALRLLAYVAYQREDYAAARQLYEEALRLARASSLTWVLSYSLVGLGDTLHQLGDFTEAEYYLTEAVGLAKDTGNRERGASALWSLGLLLRTVGRSTEALARFRESLMLYLEVGAPNIVGTRNIVPALLEGIAGVAMRENPGQAARLLGAAEELNAAAHAGENLHQDPAHARAVAWHLGQLRARLDGEAFAAAWAEGRAMSLARAVDEALRDEPAG